MKIRKVEGRIFSNPEAVQELKNALTSRGLTAAEAEGFCACWKKQFLETTGQRLIMFFPGKDYDALCPLDLHLAPRQFALSFFQFDIRLRCEAVSHVALRSKGIDGTLIFADRH